MSIVLLFSALLMGIGLLGMGILFVANPQAGLKYSGHETASLPVVMGGRYLGFGAIVLALYAIGDYRALAIAFAIGAGLGFFDAVATAKVNGLPRGHFVVGLISAGLSFLFYSASTVGVSS